MLCPKCGTETIKILGEDYCPTCSMNVLEVRKKHKSEPRSVAGDQIKVEAMPKIGKVPHRPLKSKSQISAKGSSIKALFLGFLVTITVAISFFTLISVFAGELNNISKNVLLVCVGFSAAFAGGAVVYKINPKDYIRNSIILALTLVFINAIFNLFPGFNIVRALLSLLLGTIIYPAPFMLGALVSQKIRIFNS